MTKNERLAKSEAVNKAALLHHELMRVGLYATGQLMHEVVRKAGWELAEQIEKAQAPQGSTGAAGGGILP